MTIPQITYAVQPGVAIVGQVAQFHPCQLESLPAGEAIPAGRFVQLNPATGLLQLYQETAANQTDLRGMSCYKANREPGAYAIGDMVPVMKKGRIWAEWKGTTQVSGAVPNIYHSSTIATDRGKITDAATSVTAGVEITAAPSGVKLVKVSPGAGSVALLELNLP